MDDLFPQAVDALVTWSAMLCVWKAARSRTTDPKWSASLVFAAWALSLVAIAL